MTMWARGMPAPDRMARRMRGAMARLLLAVALLAAGASPSGAASLEALARDMRVTLLDGQPAPALTLSDLRGKPVSLSDYKGRVVLLYFWASW